MEQHKKPPIGAKPAKIYIPERIKELAEAIVRFTEHERIGKDKEVSKLIMEWSTEIQGHCNTLDKLMD